MRLSPIASLLALCLVLASTPLADCEAPEGFPEGNWTGSYQLSGNDPVDARFTAAFDDEEQSWSIVMVLDLEPAEDFTYSFEEIRFEESTLSFRFTMGDSEKRCELRRDDHGQWSGACLKGDDEDDSSPARLVMRPPADPD